jgi:hypothetical protein
VSLIDDKISLILALSECARFCQIHIGNLSSLFYLTTMNIEGWFLCRSETIPSSRNSDVLLGKFSTYEFPSGIIFN